MPLPPPRFRNELPLRRRPLASPHEQLPSPPPAGGAPQRSVLASPAYALAPQALARRRARHRVVQHGGDLMHWDTERYVKLYVRDTPEFLAMSWQARCLLLELVRKVDRGGI